MCEKGKNLKGAEIIPFSDIAKKETGVENANNSKEDAVIQTRKNLTEAYQNIINSLVELGALQHKDVFFSKKDGKYMVRKKEGIISLDDFMDQMESNI